MHKTFTLPSALILLIWIGLAVNSLKAQTPTPPAGDGTIGNPYQVATLDNIYWITQNSSSWNKQFIQIADIDASSTSGWNSGSGMNPIGSSPYFTGTYDGQNHTINGIYINRKTDGQVYPTMGLFQRIDASGIVKNLGLTNVNIHGYQFTGALAGLNYGTITDCYSTGSVKGVYHWVGGLIGENGEGGVVRTSYSNASVLCTGSGSMYAGFAGSNRTGSITDCYATGTISGISYVSGFVGRNIFGGTITRVYGKGSVSGTGTNLAGLIAYNDGTVTNSFWDTETTGQSTSAAGTAKTTAQMLTQSTYTSWDFSTVWSISSSSNAGYPYLQSNPPSLPTLTWDGSVSHAWDNALNWTPEIVPTDQYHTIIANVTNEPIVYSGIGAVCNNLTVNSGASLLVASGGSLITNGTINGQITIERSVSGSSNMTANMYHLVSIPLNPSTNTVSGIFTGAYLYQYAPVSNSWLAMGTSSTTNLDENQGYMIYYPNSSTTYSFTGEPNTGTFTPTVTYPGNSDGNNFALVPNPYPSNIDWNAASGWTKTNIGNTIWIYNPVYGNYATWNGSSGTNGGSRYISVGQAFFVQTTAASPALVMNNSVRTNTSATFLKNTSTIPKSLRITATANGLADEILMGFDPNASALYNPQEDALKFFGMETAPQLYSIADDHMLSINMLAPSSSELSVPVGFECSMDGDVTINANHLDGFETDQKIMLHDLATGQSINLRQQPSYTFSHQSSNQAMRFVLTLSKLTGVQEVAKMQQWIAHKTLFVQADGYAGKTAEIVVSDMLGKTLLKTSLILSSHSTLDLSRFNGAVIVVTKLKDGTEQWATKGILVK